MDMQPVGCAGSCLIDGMSQRYTIHLPEVDSWYLSREPVAGYLKIVYFILSIKFALFY